MIKSKSWSLIVAASWLVAGNNAVWAGPQSALDPYAGVSGPNLGRGKPAAPKTYKGNAAGTYDGLTTRAEGLGRSGKRAGIGLVDNTVDVGSKLAENGKRLGQGVANKSMDSAHASGTFLMKGARVLGHGVKHTGEKIADGSQSVIENVSTWPKNIGHGLSLTGSKLADGSKVIGHKVKAGSEKLKDTTQVVAEKAAATPRVIGHGIAGSAGKVAGIVSSDDKDANAGKTAGLQKESELASSSPVVESKAVEADKEPSLVGRTAALPKAAGHQALRTAGKVGEGTQIVGKKVVALPGYMGRGIGRLFGRGGQETPQATASGPVDQIH